MEEEFLIRSVETMTVGTIVIIAIMVIIKLLFWLGLIAGGFYLWKKFRKNQEK